MIYLTGDTHGEVQRFSADSFPEQKEMTKDDYVIILGDFGLIWDYRGESGYEKYWLEWLEEKPFTTLFIDGNHENHDRLDAMPVEEWHGGKIHKIRPSIIHLMRGQVFDIDGVKVFAFGGAASHDIQDGVLEPGDPRIRRWNRDNNKLFRINKQSWWDRELPSKVEMAEGMENLDKAGWLVDFVFTHCTSASTTAMISPANAEADVLTRYLQEIKDKLKYKYWFFGHHHMNKTINANEYCLYEQIVQVN